MSVREYDLFGYAYIGSEALTYGDYVGYGDVGEANLRVVENFVEENGLSEAQVSFAEWGNWTSTYPWRADEFNDYLDEDGQPPDVFFARGGYDTHTAYVRVPPEPEDGEEEDERRQNLRELVDLINGLETYPVLSDDTVSEVAMEREEQMWENWLQDDLLRTLPDFWRDLGEYERHPEASPAQENAPMYDAWEAWRQAMEVTNSEVIQEPGGAWVDVKRIKSSFLYYVVEQVTRIPPPLSSLFGFHLREAPEDSPYDVDEWEERVEEWVRDRIEEIRAGIITWEFQQDELEDYYAELQDKKVA